MSKESIRPVCRIRVIDKRGYSYIPIIIRDELAIKGKGAIPCYLNANCVLLVRKGANKKKVIQGLDVLKKDIELRSIARSKRKHKPSALSDTERAKEEGPQ